MTSDLIFMKRAIDLAKNGSGSVSPNPLVGCVIVKDGRIIGEGWHKNYGGPHAEVNAIESVNDKALLRSSSVFVNLEPCSHFGKTPPCADLLVSHAVKRVVIANRDNNPLVNGTGIRKLQESGIDVVTGPMEKEAWDLNRRFFTFMEHHRPYIILKWAQTSDGFLADATKGSKWISNEFSRQLVHRWRSEEDAILVGKQTVAADNPQLTVRDWTGRSPVRIVLDRFRRLDGPFHVFDGKQKTICYNTMTSEDRPNLSFVKVDEHDFIGHVVADLYHRKIQSLIVEGGGRVLELFVQAGLWDEARVFESSTAFGAGLPAPRLPGLPVAVDQIVTDSLKFYRNDSGIRTK